MNSSFRWLCTLALLACHPVLALDPALDINQYAHKSWKIRDGFPAGTVESIAQTADGYLWLGTTAGLIRFDGISHVRADQVTNDAAANGAIRSLLGARDGSLWVGTARGLMRWGDGKIARYGDLGGFDVYALVEDNEGTIWAAGYAIPQAKICRIRSGTVQCENLSAGVTQLYEDSQHSLWAGTGAGLWRWKPEPAKLYSISRADPLVTAVIEAKPGEMLAGTLYGVYPVTNSGFNPQPLPDSISSGPIRRLMRDRDGAVWIGTSHGLLHVRSGWTGSYTRSDGLAGEVVTSLFEDREGNVWVGTQSGGLDQFRGYAISTMTRHQGLSGSTFLATLAAPDGSIWVSESFAGLSRFKDGEATHYRLRSASPSERRDDQAPLGHRVRESVDAGLPDEAIHSLAMDSQGRLWVGGVTGVSVLTGEHFSRRLSQEPIRIYALLSNGAGSVWISDERGLVHLVGERVTGRTPWDRFGSRGYATTLLSDPQTGGLWLGFSKGGVALLKEGQQIIFDERHDGLGSGQVKSLYFDEQETLWAATEGGLSRLKNHRVQTLTSSAGLPCSRVHWVIQDDLRFFWLGTSCGVLRIDERELERWASGAASSVHPTVFDSADGVIGEDNVPDCSPLVTRAPDGKLWFIANDGLSVIDPRHLVANSVPPPVHVEQIVADRNTYAPLSPLRLPPLVRDLQINYTGLSFVAPEKVMFRYKLEGHDHDWQNVGTRRQAFYTDLPPGNYRFRVVASNNSGVWNTQGTSLDFSIAPAYWQTNWFRALCVAAVVALLALLYWLRIRQVAHRFDLLVDARVGERTRIARELHDTLLQSFNSAFLRFGLVEKLLATRPDEAREMLHSAMNEARAAITEGRQSVQGLRSSVIETNDLSESIRNLAQQLASESPRGAATEVRLNVIGTPRALRPLVRDEIYRIAGEALRNAFRHAEASRIEVQLGYDARRFELRVRDDGKGIDARFLGDQGLAGHFGLPGMRERAQQLGGKLMVWSAEGAGTEVELTLPAARAYGRSRASPARDSEHRG